MEVVAFKDKHHCPQCRQLLSAEELTCTRCGLKIAFCGEDGRLYVHVVDIGMMDTDTWIEFNNVFQIEQEGQCSLRRYNFPTTAMPVCSASDGTIEDE